MALPPWTVELLRRGVADLARQASDPETAASLKEQAGKLVEELPRVAREKVDTLLRQAEATTQPLRDAWSGANPLRQPQSLINGSGSLTDPRGSGVAVDASVLSAAAPFMMGDRAAPVASDVADPTISLQQTMHNETGLNVRVMVLGSLDAGIALLATRGRRGGRLIVPRCCAEPTPLLHGKCLADALQDHTHGGVREFGSTTGINVTDLEQTVHVADSGDHRGGGGHRSTTLVRLPKTCCVVDPETRRSLGVDEVVVMPIGRLVGKDIAGHATAASLLQDGADAVLLCGGVMTGTTEMAILVGREEVIGRWVDHPRHALWRASDAHTAMLTAATKLAASGNLPIDHLMAAGEENLRDRAERLATQLSGLDGVASVQVTDAPATMIGSDGQVPSRQVVLSATNVDPTMLAERLLTGPTCFSVGTNDHGISMDLRWISPDQQARIAQLIGDALHPSHRG